MKSKKIPQKQINFYYSFLTIFLFCCVISLSKTVVFNIAKLISYQNKLAELQTLHTKAVQTHRLLKAEIDGFKFSEAYKAIARNYLNMVGENEIKVIIIQKEK